MLAEASAWSGRLSDRSLKFISSYAALPGLRLGSMPYASTKVLKSSVRVRMKKIIVSIFLIILKEIKLGNSSYDSKSSCKNGHANY